MAPAAAAAVQSSCCSSGVVGSALSAALQFFAATQCLVREPWPQHAAVANGSKFDFIVVGAGTGGSTVAARLAAANFTVLLVEAGPDPPQEAIIPGFHSVMLSGPYDWKFTTTDDRITGQALSGGSQKQPRGRMLGGSGSINNMIYARGFPADYDEWATIAGSHWNWENVLPYFKKTEKVTDEHIVHNENLIKYHGTDGEIEVSGRYETTEAIKRFLEAFKEIGFNIVDDMTNPHKIGAGMFSHTIKEGKRHSSLTALLNKATGDNIFVLKNSLVTKILTENNTAVGVKVLINGNEMHFKADKEVIVSAGTFNSPKLLMLSGIGPKDHLHEIGISVVKDLPVGGNLHDHVMFLNYIAAKNGTCYTSEATQHKNVIDYLYDRSGPLANADSMGALLALKPSDPNTPDFAYYPTCIPQGSNFNESCLSIIGLSSDVCEQLGEANKNSELLSIAVVLLKPKSRGKVRLRSCNPLDDPVIYSGTFDNPADLKDYPVAVDVVHALARSTYFKEKSAKFVDLKVSGCDGEDGPDKVRCKAKAMATSAWHAVGTAAMGQVVDGELRVLGVEGLRVVDASVMAKVPRGNTNAPVVMLAEKAVDFIKKAYGAE